MLVLNLRTMQVIGHQIIRLQDVDSTNNYAANLVNTPFAPDGTVILAHNQFGGKGQRGASWQVEGGLSLTFSVIIYPKNTLVTDQFDMSMLTALAVAKTVSTLCPAKVAIKWPNDILIEDKKVAGILIENNISGNKISNTIIGIGLNVNQLDFPGLPNATSLAIELGDLLDRDEVLFKVLNRLDYFYQVYLSQGRNSISERYHDMLYRKGLSSQFLVSNQLVKGKILGVKQNGLIEIEISSGQIKSFDLKEIQLVY